MESKKQEEERLINKYQSPMHYVLASLIPYSESGMKLAFKPSVFFNDLEKLDKIKERKQSLRSAYYRAIKQKLIVVGDDSIPRLTEKGLRKVKPYNPTMIKGASLLVIFDIPEHQRHKRRRLRLLLKELAFTQIQKSVWQSRYDHRKYLRAEIADMHLQEYVKVYESAQIEI